MKTPEDSHALRVGLVAVACLLCSSAGVRAQLRGPADTRPPLPSFEPSPSERGSILPPVIPPDASERLGLSLGDRLRVREVVFRGGSALPADVLREIAARYQGRELDAEELRQLRDEVTRAYVERGFVTSGARIPEQSLADGVLEIDLVEGRLGELHIHSQGRLRESWIRARVQPPGDEVLNVYALERRLQLLQEDPRTERVTATLLPAEGQGASRLDLHFSEAQPWRALLEASNYQPVSIGEARGLGEFEWLDVTGFGDALRADLRGSEGLIEVGGGYRVPLDGRDTTLDLSARGAWAEIVDPDFAHLDIEGRTQSYGIRLESPLWRAPGQRLGVSLGAEWRRSHSFLLGSGFSFVDGPEDGRATIAVLRGGLEGVFRGSRQVLALSSLLSIGLDVLGATQSQGSSAAGRTPDGRFVAWLGQAQWALRVPWMDSQLLARGDVQISADPLLGLEQFAIGGRSSVRGYREDAVVRDSGWDASLEWRVPLWRRGAEQPFVELAPFLDAGGGWNVERASRTETLVGIGVGLRMHPFDGFSFELYWGEDLLDVPEGSRRGLQGRGLHLAAVWRNP